MSKMYLNVIISNVAYINCIYSCIPDCCAESHCNQYCHELVVEATGFNFVTNTLKSIYKLFDISHHWYLQQIYDV